MGSYNRTVTFSQDVRRGLDHADYASGFAFAYDWAVSIQLWMASFKGREKRRCHGFGCLSTFDDFLVYSTAFFGISHDKGNEIFDLWDFLYWHYLDWTCMVGVFFFVLRTKTVPTGTNSFIWVGRGALSGLFDK